MFPAIDRWFSEGKRVALARVVDVEGSGPRDAGATMAVSQDGEVTGSVSGGCVEGAVVTEALEVLAIGVARRCVFGYSDEEALEVGLTCGGTLHVLVEPLTGDGPALHRPAACTRRRRAGGAGDRDGPGGRCR